MLLLTGAMAADAPAAPTDGITFLAPKARLWLGRTQMICFQVAQPAAQDRYYSFQVDEKILHLVVPPQILKGERLGYLRVQPLTEGKTRVGIEGAKLDLDIVRDASARSLAELTPQIVTPANGAKVWGDFVVGVEQLTLGDPTQLAVPTLLLPNGKEITSRVVPDQKPGPHARWVFDIKNGDLSRGLNSLVALQKQDDGRLIRSKPLEIEIINPASDTVVSGDCKDYQNGDHLSNGGFPNIVNDDKYNKGQILDSSDEGRCVCLPVWTDKKAEYQLVVTARGEFGSDALPTIAVVVDESSQPTTTARLATSEWQRIPIGRPFPLDPGGHMLSVRIRSGFNRGPDDTRFLYLQKYELARIDPSGNAPAADAGAPMMAMMAGGGGDASDLHVAFRQNIDRQMITGAVDFEGEVRRTGWGQAPFPRVELYINKQLAATQISDRPHWTIDPAAFVPGINLVELKATTPSGASASSTPLRVELPAGFPAPGHPYRPTVGFTPQDSGLCNMTPPLKQSDPSMACFYSNAQSTVRLPDNLAGKYRIVIDAKGDDFQGPPIMAVSLKSGGAETKLGEFKVGSQWGPVKTGDLVLASGEKEITIAFTNDAYEKDKGDRNLYVRAVRLVPVNDPDTAPPVAAIAYAPKECAPDAADAVVARVMDNQRIASVDLVVDDQAQHLDLRPRNGLGPVVLPLITRDLKPGTHRLKVAARDDAGNQGFSPESIFNVSASPAAAPSRYERAVFLLNRFAYGPEPSEIADILTTSEQAWLDSRLRESATTPAEQNFADLVREEYPNVRDYGQVTRGAVEYILGQPNPVRARFVMWAENHFSTWINKDGIAAKAAEHESFVEVGPAPFFDLLLTSATSPAMLYYLDQRNSVARHINENYAREIMELHTLGVKGGYTQKDVTTLADLLTGWTLNDEAADDGGSGDSDRFFGFDPRLSSGAACRVLGVEFPGVEPEHRFDRIVMALEMLTAHPSCATFVSRRLCEHYVSDPPPPKLVDDLAQVYIQTSGDIPAMLEAMAVHPDFWASAGRVTSPVDFGVRAARLSHSTNAGAIADLASASGMGVFDRATPDGYPEDNGFYMSSNALLQRWHFSKYIQNEFLNTGLISQSLRPPDNGWTPEVTQHLIDVASIRITGRLLGQASNDAAQKLIAEAPPGTDVRLHALAIFICQSPENSLR